MPTITSYLQVVTALFISFGLSAQDDSTTTEEYPSIEIECYSADDHCPITYHNVDMDQMESKNTGQEASFLISETPSMNVYSDAGSYQGYSYFTMRGIDQTRINMTLDGVPLNEPEDQGVYFSNYPDFINSIDKIQIQRGVGTSKNGTSSYAGSIQFSTPNLSDTGYTQIGTGYGSYNTYRAYGEYNMGVKNNKGLYIRASHINSDGFKNRSANNSQSVFYSAGLFNKNSTYKLTGFVGQQHNQMAWLGVSQADIDINPRTNGNVAEDDHFMQALVQLQQSIYLSDNSSLQASIYYNHLQGNYDFNFDNFLGIPLTGELYNYALKSHFTGIFSNYIYEKDKVSWTTGVHGNLYSREHIGSELALGELYQNTGYKDELSAFSKINYRINKFNLFADIQYRYNNFDYVGSVPFDQLNWTFINPKAGINFRNSEKTIFYYSIGRTGREPTRTDLFGGNDDLLTDSTGAPTLFINDPEYVLDQELGMRYESEKFQAISNIYFMSFQNEIVLNGQLGPNGLALNSNVDKSIRTGFEISASYQCKNWKFSNNSSYNHSRITNQSESFAPVLTPAIIVNQDVAYSNGNLETGISLRYQSGAYIDFSNDNQLEDYVLVNLRASYTWKKLKYSLFINNLLNKIYYNGGYVDFDGTRKYFVQAPNNYYLSLNYTF